ncbi:MAG: extracellular solute-binding protein [Eubacteriales bacterium]|nr:extracellular solute-binding protein [Eubacteriales bacterium]
MKKRMLAALLSAAMVATALAGCGSSSSGTGGSTSADSGNAEASDTASSGEKVKLKALFISHSLTQDVEDMEWVQEMEDEAGVEIEWEQIRADWETVKSTRFASGDIPDLLFNATTSSDYTKYNGLFLDMTPYITEEITPNIVQMFEEEPDTKTLATTLEGKIYATPKFQGKWPSTNTVMFINQTWLDNLGLKIPTTYTELKEVLTAFKEQDANGNGDPTDEIPLDYNAYGGNNAWFNSAYSLTNLLGSLGIQLTNWGTDAYFAEDSTVKCYAVDERYKLFMEYIADLYANGLINTNALTNDYSAFQSLSRGNEAGEAVVGVVFGWEETDKFGPTLYEEYVPVPALDYDIDCEPGTYDTRWRDDYTGLNMSSDRAVISAKCENPEAAMRFIDRFYDQTHSVEALFGGVTDGNIEVTGDNSYKVLDPQDPDTDPGTWKWTSTFADNAPMYIRRSSEIEMAQDMTFALEEREVYNDVIAKADKTDTYPQMFMKYTEEDQNTMALTQANINNIIDNQWSLWMTGEQDIESTWDAYVQSVYDAGLQQILDIRQAAFDEYLKGVE